MKEGIHGLRALERQCEVGVSRWQRVFMVCTTNVDPEVYTKIHVRPQKAIGIEAYTQHCVDAQTAMH